jgi:hypothetical protein
LSCSRIAARRWDSGSDGAVGIAGEASSGPVLDIGALESVPLQGPPQIEDLIVEATLAGNATAGAQ